MNTLSVDIGGSKLKATVLDDNGKMLTDYVKVKTPEPATPENVMNALKGLVGEMNFDRISAGFPGYIRDGIVHTAPNLGTEYWSNVNLPELLQQTLGKPARAANDADTLGLGIVEGKGFEMVVTLGTGFGTAFYKEGKLLPHLEISHHPIRNGETYDEYIGKKALKKIGDREWLERVKYILGVLKTVFNYDTLYVGGGNAKLIDFPLPPNVKLVTNMDGIDGGFKLWTAE